MTQQIFIFSLLLIAYYTLHSLLANKKIKTTLQSFIARPYYRLFYNIVAILTFIGIGILFKQLPVQWLSNPIPTVGLPILVAGTFLLYAALRQYNLSEFLGTAQLSKEHLTNTSVELNRSGLNRYVRHPLYTATFVLLIGCLLVYPTTKTLTVVVISSLYLIIGTRLEEQKLVEEFGEIYRQYQKEVGRFLPKRF